VYVYGEDEFGREDYDFAWVFVINLWMNGGGYLAVGDTAQISLGIDPGYSMIGTGRATLKALSGGNKIIVWDGGTQVSLPHTWNLWRYVPSTLYVHANEPSDSLNDVVLEWSYDYWGPTIDSETINFTTYSTDVPITVELEDPKVNGVRSGLDESSLWFSLNQERIPNSELTLERTLEEVDGEQILAKLKVTYIPPRVKLIVPGTNTVQIIIYDMVMNLMEPVLTTFIMP
jgi:hypothetical protein